MAAQDWLLVGILLAIVGGALYVGSRVSGANSEVELLLLVVSLIVGLGGYVNSLLHASAARD